VAWTAKALNVRVYVLTTLGKGKHVVNVNGTSKVGLMARGTLTLTRTLDHRLETGSGIVATRYCLAPLAVRLT
jgi:hypothetical protein